QALGVAALGTNCGNGPEETEQVVREMLQAGPKLPLVAYPNAGRPELRDGRAVYTVDSETMAAYARRYVELGVRIVGACCGSTPAHVAAIARAVREARGERHSVA
ncbi:MAG TPA: homocysteine S-methyltransferase family protein, partial [Chloroflexota bacterium]